MVVVAYMTRAKNSAFTELGRLDRESDRVESLLFCLVTRYDAAGMLEVVSNGSKAVATARYCDNGIERYDNLVEARLKNDQLFPA
jgi:hypothetical protein